jgi:hypothetical protein
MDAHRDREHPPDTDPLAGWPPGPLGVRIRDHGEIVAALPHLLGFRPQESVVLLGLGGPGGRRVGLTVRADIPPPENAGPLAAVLARSLSTDGPDGALVVVVSEAPDDGPPGDRCLPHRDLVGEMVRGLAAHGVPVRDALFLRGGRFWSYDCPYPCCGPGAGTPVPVGVSELEVAAVATGTVVERDRDGLLARITPPPGQDRGAMAAACARVAVECSTAALDSGPAAVAAQSWSAVTDAAARCRPGAAPAGALSDGEVARVVWGLRDGDVRDRAIGLALGPEPAAAEQLWTECTRRAPAPLDAGPATLLAVSAWLRGDGAMANIALARALESDPDYVLARLLSDALAACVTPSELRSMLTEVAVLPRVG